MDTEIIEDLLTDLRQIWAMANAFANGHRQPRDLHLFAFHPAQLAN
jgi:hypothetical protein